MDTSERRKYVAELVEKTGIRIDEDDPIFAIVLLNRAILEDQKTALEASGDKLRDEIAQFHADLNKLAGTAKEQVTAHIETTANASVIDMQKRFVDAITDTAKVEMQKAIEPVKSASADELARLEKAARSLGSEADYSRDRWKLCVYSAALSSLFVAVLVFAAALFAVNKLQLNDDEKRQLKMGQQIEAVWSDLDQRTRDRLNSAMKAKAEQ